MPPETPPPDDARRGPSSSSSEGGNVVDPAVLAERRAQRAEQAEQSAERRATDAQVLAAQLARERARLEAERDAARAEAAAAREGADAAIAEARHLQSERDTLRDALIDARRERDALAAARDEARAAPAVAEPTAPVEPPAASTAPPTLATAAPEPAPPAPANGSARNGHAAPPAAWAAGLRRELAVARTTAAVSAPPSAPTLGRAVEMPALVRERRIVAQRVAAGPVPAAKPVVAAEERRGERAAPITALTLERERSSRLQAQLDASLAVQRELRTQIAALQRAVQQRVEAEQRIEMALRRVREELTAANAFATQRTAATEAAPPVPPPAAADASAVSAVDTEPAAASAPAGPPRAAAGSAAPAVTPMPPAATQATVPPLPESSAPKAPAAAAPAAPAEQPRPASVAPPPPALDPQRLSAARERLRAAAPPPAGEERPVALPTGPPAPWVTAALQRLLATEPETAGRLAVGLLPAAGLAADEPLRYDVLLAARACLAVDVTPRAPATVVQRPAPRPRGERDLSIAGDAAGIARLLHGRRTLLRRPARVRGGRKALRELRRLARAPLGLRELGAAGVALEPALALKLVALAIEPGATQGERFALAHAPLAGGPVDAWLRIADGAEPSVVTTQPPEPTRLTLRCTRGALLALIAGVEPPPGEAGTLDGDLAALTLLRGWIARTEHPAA
ncbi:MAG: hypothetical protein ACTHOE_09420 [Conexibacter sp.]